MAYSAVAVEGGIFPADLLDRITAGETGGQRQEDFGLKSGQRLSDEMQAAFSDMRSYWDAFQRRQLKSKESLTTLTRDFWVIPLLESLGFKLEYQRRAAAVEGDTFAISHRAGDNPDASPVHLVALDQPLDRRGEARRSPHALVQEYLNRSDALWGLVTNGDKLRLLRNTARLSRPSYVEFDLRAMVEANLYSEFVIFYRLLHRSRFPRGEADAHECWLEKYYQQGIDEGGRVREHLREGVEVALQELGNGFLVHPESVVLRQAIQEGRLQPAHYYRQLLRLVYRLLFLMVAEERRLLFPTETPNSARQVLYTRYYSIGQLRQRCERHWGDDHYHDLWDGLLKTFYLFQDEQTAAHLGLSALDGELFGPLACPDLEGAKCGNARLLKTMYHLSTFSDGRVRRRINYAALDVEELGSVYESLLDYQPHIEPGDQPRFELAWGGERRQTGSFYTPPELVRELIESALLPVIAERLAGARTREEKEAALRGLKVCDPASGSGHFLLAAARRLGRELARIRTGEMEPSPEAYRQAVRDIIRECLYAVDKNPLAVDLCKVALWLEGHCEGLPLSFMDHHVKCGDSLVGVFDLGVLKDGIPDDAYKPVTGDDRQAASQYKRRNREERDRQSSLFQEQLAQAADGPRALAPDFAALSGLAELTPQDVQAKAELYESLRQGSTWHQLQVTCDLWTAAFFSQLTAPSPGQTPLTPTTATVWGYLTQPGAAHGQVVGKARELSVLNRFFHWPLEFPEVFAAGGFDVVLGNPPWEQIQAEEIKFFASHGDHEIANLSGAKRKKAIENLFERNPRLAFLWDEYVQEIESYSKFIRESDRFSLTARGKLNTYAVFAETMRGLLNALGRVGCIVPSGIATDDSTKFFFQDLVRAKSLASLYSFENEEFIFPAIHHATKFCLLTLSGTGRPQEDADLVFFARRPAHLKEDHRHFRLTPDEIALINPNTHTCPIFRSSKDAEITKAIYRRVAVLLKEGSPIENPWKIQFRQGLFNMTSDSHLFRTREQLVGEGWTLHGNTFHQGEEMFLPLYEGKMFWHFDHRFGTYEGQTQAQANQGKLPELDEARHADPNYLSLPRYWVHNEHVQKAKTRSNLGNYYVAFRDVTSSVVLRTAIFAVLPGVAVGHTGPLLISKYNSLKKLLCLVGCLNAFVLDYVCRQCLGGTHLTFFILKQLPVLPPDQFSKHCPWNRDFLLLDWIVPRALELTYTAWDLAPLGQDLSNGEPPFRWDEERRFLIRCELDAAFFHLYGLSRDEVDYIMDTFSIVKQRDEQQHAEYRTKRVILEIYDELQRAMSQGEPYRTRLDPPPGDPRVAHRG
jgi:hypothetical protein